VLDGVVKRPPTVLALGLRPGWHSASNRLDRARRRDLLPRLDIQETGVRLSLHYPD
jgi:hypothetical protein